MKMIEIVVPCQCVTVTKKRVQTESKAHKRSRSGIAVALIAVGIGAFFAAGYAWGQHLSDEGDVVAANVFYSGAPVEGMTGSQVRSMVALDAQAKRSQEMAVNFDDGSIDVLLGDIGFNYDVTATVDSIMSARHTGSVFEHLWDWVTVPLAEIETEPIWTYSQDEAVAYFEDQPALTPAVPVEPDVTGVNNDSLYVIAGEIGSTVDLDHLTAELEGIDFLAPPSAVVAVQKDVLPAVTDFEAEDVASRYNALTRPGMQLSVRGIKKTIPARDLNTYLHFTPAGDTLTGEFDNELLQYTIEEAYIEPIGEFSPPTLSVFDDEVILVEAGEPTPVCCRAGTGEWAGTQLLAGATGPFGLPTRAIDDAEMQEWADGSTVVEKVSEFTTPHSCCESRVKNIQRFADIVRGAYIIPGDALDLNEYVGRRTRENGFVGAGAIRTGYLTEEVGGGVSQFATTIFNAAYFAGMDFDAYQSHSIYFSRYPYGREATISWPTPDLILRNTTDYPILVWTSYTDRSITVSMYSTKHVQVAELGQRTFRRSACRHVETERQRTYHDRRVVVDVIEANYRPADGIDCNGNPIPKPGQ